MASTTRGGISRGGGRMRDPMWKHGTPGVVAREVICYHCMKIMTGSIYRLKIHLAKISGQNITVCDKCPEEVEREAKTRLSESEQKKVNKKRTTEAMAAPMRDISSIGSKNIGEIINLSELLRHPAARSVLDEMEREAVEWVAEVAECEEVGDEFADPEEAVSSLIEDIAVVAAATATPYTSAPTQRQQSFVSFSGRRNL
ncbi:hypothetical protein SUGI_1072190 [Cryptomeria japonica]|nr:hypothetical protein SUGI_1072190 [Cryptomeria japonica]